MSSYSSPSVDTNFPHTSLTTIDPNSPPSYASLSVIAKELNANAISVHSNRGNGKLGHLSLTITTTAYLVKSGNVVFDIPLHPGTQASHAVGATSYQITEANRQHDAQLKDFYVYQQTDNILKRLLLAAIPDTYTDAIKDDDTGYGSITTLTIITHLLDTYGEISDREIEDNIATMSTPWSPSTPIEDLFRQLNIAQKFSVKANDPISDKVYIRVGLKLIKEAGILVDTCREWSLLPSTSRTKVQFHLVFAKAFRYHTETETVQSAGLQNPHESYDVANAAYDHLLAAAQDPALRGWLPPPTPPTLDPPTIASPPNHVMPPPSQPYTPDLAATATTGQAETGINAAFTYCWTHGLIARNPNNTQPDRIHTSATCFNQAQGHQMSSTLTNMLGGNATVYQAPRNNNRGGRDGGRGNGRHRGGRGGGRGTGRRGGRRQNAQPVAAEPTAAVSPDRKSVV